MQANELRIGNIVEMQKYIGIPVMANKWDVLQIIADDIFQCVAKPDDFRPIVLTKEWLIRFGAKLNDDELTIPVNRHLYVSFFDDECQLATDDDFLVTDIHHVHQLQNLYFALTGEELKLIEP